MNQYGNKNLINQKMLNRRPVTRLISAVSSGKFLRITVSNSRGLLRDLVVPFQQ